MSYISSISQELKKLYFLEVVGSGNKTFMIHRSRIGFGGSRVFTPRITNMETLITMLLSFELIFLK